MKLTLVLFALLLSVTGGILLSGVPLNFDVGRWWWGLWRVTEADEEWVEEESW